MSNWLRLFKICLLCLAESLLSSLWNCFRIWQNYDYMEFRWGNLQIHMCVIMNFATWLWVGQIWYRNKNCANFLMWKSIDFNMCLWIVQKLIWSRRMGLWIVQMSCGNLIWSSANSYVLMNCSKTTMRLWARQGKATKGSGAASPVAVVLSTLCIFTVSTVPTVLLFYCF